MIRTQVQIPDELHRAAKSLAGRLEISLTELVRRGLEYMVSVTSPFGPGRDQWSLPQAERLGGVDPFQSPDWREQIHTGRAMVAEPPGEYGDRGEPT